MYHTPAHNTLAKEEKNDCWEIGFRAFSCVPALAPPLSQGAHNHNADGRMCSPRRIFGNNYKSIRVSLINFGTNAAKSTILNTSIDIN
jgi:hypothetical protein